MLIFVMFDLRRHYKTMMKPEIDSFVDRKIMLKCVAYRGSHLIRGVEVALLALIPGRLKILC